MSRQIKKHLTFMKICERMANLSYDPKHQVGAILVKNDWSEIHAIGYNGNYKGGPNKRDSLEHGQSGFLHAEDNLLIKSRLAYDEYEKYTLFITMTPCEMCAKKLVNAGVKNIIQLNEYENAGNTYKIFRKAKIKIEKLKDIITKLYLKSNQYNELAEIIDNNIDKSVIENLLVKHISDFFDNDKNLLADIMMNNFVWEKSDKKGIVEDFIDNYFNVIYKMM